MKRFFTTIAGSALFTTLLLAGFNGNAQTTLASAETKTTATKTEAPAVAAETKTAVKAAAEDTSWKPQRRLWGYAFGDFYYNSHADAGNRGAENMYNGVPQWRNAFQFRRLYLGYDYEITKKFKAEVLLASEPNANTGAATGTSIQNGDNLVDGKMAFWVKNFNLRVREIWPGTDFVIGEMATPGFALNEPGTNGATSLSEATWGFRSIEKTISDIHKTNSYDVGAALQGTFDPETKNFGYVFMVGNNSQSSLLGATNPNTGFFKIFYGDIWAKIGKHVLIDFYADDLKTAGNSTVGGVAVGPQSHNMFKIFAAYTAKPVTIGVEAYMQNFSNGVMNSTTHLPEDATAKGFSAFIKGSMVKNLNYFARVDAYNPDSKFNKSDSYAVNTNLSSYNPTNKEMFYTFGLDYNPIKNVHFMPNVWLVDYKDQRDPATAGYVAPDHNLVFRFTFYYVFGK